MQYIPIMPPKKYITDKKNRLFAFEDRIHHIELMIDRIVNREKVNNSDKNKIKKELTDINKSFKKFSSIPEQDYKDISFAIQDRIDSEESISVPTRDIIYLGKFGSIIGSTLLSFKDDIVNTGSLDYRRFIDNGVTYISNMINTIRNIADESAIKEYLVHNYASIIGVLIGMVWIIRDIYGRVSEKETLYECSASILVGGYVILKSVT